MLQTEEGVDVSIGSDKSITSKVSNANLEAEVKVNANAEAEAKIIVQKRVEVTMKSPKGSEVRQENSGRVTSNITLRAITKTGVNPVEVKMSAEVEGNLVAFAKVTDESDNTQIFNLSLPNSIISGGMELVVSESDINTYTAIKSTFKTSEDFILNSNSRKVVVEGSNIQIIGATAWQKFEERQYFNGRRTITLLLGDAKILRDGVEEVMIKDTEYEFTPINNSNSSISETNGITTLNTIYENSYLTIRYGWNLITTPIDKELNILDKFPYTTQSYKYSDKWIKNPTTIKLNEGVWIKYSVYISEKIEGDSYEPLFNNLSDSWNLIGAGRDINLYELFQFTQVWVYDSKIKTWIKNPTVIKRGYGFWAK